jgi:hypothetical protein
MSRIVAGCVGRAWPEHTLPPARCSPRSPVGNTYLAGIDEPTAHFLQQIAWDTVQDYYGK